jgi:hypothetical protein
MVAIAQLKKKRRTMEELMPELVALVLDHVDPRPRLHHHKGWRTRRR